MAMVCKAELSWRSPWRESRCRDCAALAISTGAGANARIAIGTAVIGGMLTATVLALFYIPFFFVLVRRGVRDGVARLRGKPTGYQGGKEQAA